MQRQSRRDIIWLVGLASTGTVAGCIRGDTEGDGTGNGSAGDTDGSEGTLGPEGVVREHPDGDAYIDDESDVNFDEEITIHEVDRRTPEQLAAESAATPAEIRSDLEGYADQFGANEAAIVSVSVTRGSGSERFDEVILVVQVEGRWLVAGD